MCDDYYTYKGKYNEVMKGNRQLDIEIEIDR